LQLHVGIGTKSGDFAQLGLTLLDRGYTGHEHLQSVGLIHMNGRLYDPKLHRFLQPDNYVQDPSNPQNYNRYGYCWNNPLKYTDESGEWIWIVVAAVVGGVINWGIHGFRMDMEGLKAFGIGAAAGTIGALTGGAGFAAAGGGAGGVGGFFAGAFGGLVGSATSSSFLSMGNHVAFGDPLMSGKDFVKGLVFGAVTGGVFNGIAALANSRNFWNGPLCEVFLKKRDCSAKSPDFVATTIDNKPPDGATKQNKTKQKRKLSRPKKSLHI
jgi:RHS repeat-associated protein